MGKKKSNKKNKKSVADLVLKHHFKDNAEVENIEEMLVDEDVEEKDSLVDDEMTTVDEVVIPVEDEFSDGNIDENLETESVLSVSDESLGQEENPVSDENQVKEDVKEFLQTSDEILSSVEEKNQENSEEAVKQLQEFLNRVDRKVDRLAKLQAEKDDEIDIVGDDFQFKKFKNELTFFQNELDESIHGQFGDLSETVTTVVSEMKRKVEELQEYLETDTKKQLNQILNDVNAVKSELDLVSQEVDAIDKQAIFETEKRTKQIVGLTKKSKDDVIAEIQDLKRITARAGVLDTYNEENKALFERTNQDNVELFNKTNAENVALFETRTAENLAVVKNELAQVRNNLHTQIQEVLRKIVIQDEIKSLCDDALTEIRNNNTEIGVVRKFMKGTQAVEQRQEELLDEIRILLEDLSEYELNEASDKVDIIYENIGMLNEWANKSDKLNEDFAAFNDNFGSFKDEFGDCNDKVDIIYENISILNDWANKSDRLIEDFNALKEEFGINSDKVDIVYDNLMFINEWVKTLDKFAKDIEDLKSDFERDEKLTDKIDSLYTNINAIKDWSKKADALALQVRALSVQISETESTINSQNLADIKELFTQMTEDMSNLSYRTNKMILDTDKTNDRMVAHLDNLNMIIESLKNTSTSFEFSELKNKIDLINFNAQKRTDFENVLTESFGYLAEWIDSAGTAINQIRSDINNVQNQQEEQVEQINKQYNEQVERLSEIKNSFAEMAKQDELDEQAENDMAEQIAEIIAQNNLAVQNVVRKQNKEIQEILANQNQQIQKLLDEQQLQAQDIQALQLQTSQNSLNITQVQEQSEQVLKNVQQIQEQSAVNVIQEIQEQSLLVAQTVQSLKESSMQLVDDVQQIKSELADEIKQNQAVVTPIVKNSGDDEILTKLSAITEYIEQKDDSNQIVESIETKISALKPDNSEIKNLLDFIAAQVVNANENSMKTEALSRKIDLIETKLSSLEQYMARLIEYLDEDE